jgi:hypothetical protein
MRLALLKGNLETTNFSFERRYMTNSANSDTPQFVGATTSFSEFARVLICCTTFTSAVSGLDTCCVSVSERGDNACSHEAEFETSASGGVLRIENRQAHVRLHNASSKPDVIQNFFVCEPVKYRSS